MPDSCTKAQLWLRGPEFLWQDDNSWPERPGVLPPLPESDPEIKRESKVNAAVSVSQEELYKLLNYYSSWYKLLKALTLLSRFKQFIRWKFAPGKGAVELPETGNLTVAELQQARNDVLKLVQAESFPDVKRGMKNYDAFPNFSKTGSSVGNQAPSSLRKLRPILVKGIYE